VKTTVSYRDPDEGSRFRRNVGIHKSEYTAIRLRTVTFLHPIHLPCNYYKLNFRTDRTYYEIAAVCFIVLSALFHYCSRFFQFMSSHDFKFPT
jgi:hypothetical protein